MKTQEETNAHVIARLAATKNVLLTETVWFEDEDVFPYRGATSILSSLSNSTSIRNSAMLETCYDSAIILVGCQAL